MAKRLVHVRFTLSELVQAVRIHAQATTRPLAADALTAYWEWAASLGWRIVSFSTQMDPSQAMLVLESRAVPQIELRCEEFWNVVFEGESEAIPDLVFEMKVADRRVKSLFNDVLAVLQERGWRINLSDSRLEKGGDHTLLIPFVEVKRKCSDLGDGPAANFADYVCEEVADALEEDCYE